MLVESLSGAFESRNRPGLCTEAVLLRALLLSQALVAFAIEYEKERRGPIQWAANILRGMGDDGAEVPPLPKRGTHSERNLERLGIVIVDRDKVVRLTATGRAMGDAYGPLCEQIESRWRGRLGSSLIDDVIEAVRVDGDWRPFPLVAWTGAEFSLLVNGDSYSIRNA